MSSQMGTLSRQYIKIDQWVKRSFGILLSYKEDEYTVLKIFIMPMKKTRITRNPALHTEDAEKSPSSMDSSSYRPSDEDASSASEKTLKKKNVKFKERFDLLYG